MRVALALVVLIGLSGCGHRPEGPSVALLMIDTLRKDHLRLYGYERHTSDNIDALAEQGWVFDDHVATASQTVPSTLSLMVSQYPSEHGLRHEGPGHFFRNPPRFPRRLRLLAEVFRDAGYVTAGFVANPFLKHENGFDQGFQRFDAEEVPAERLTSLAIDWLHELRTKRPFFLYVHYFDVHWPYEPPPAFRVPHAGAGKVVYDVGPTQVSDADLRATIAAYDGEIAYVDSEIGRLLTALVAVGRRDETVIVVTSDHGDEFLDHGGMGHGTTVYGELVRVPLVLAFPPAFPPGRRVGQLTSHVDLGPTLLALAGIEPPRAFHGRTLQEPARFVFSENGPWRAVYGGGWKLVLNTRTHEEELFESDDERDQHPVESSATAALLDDVLARYSRLETHPRSDLAHHQTLEWQGAEKEHLRALGYAD